MWMIHPIWLCNQHLVGEHGEIHKFRHNFVKQHSMTNRRGQIVPFLMEVRHDELVKEMCSRGMNHNSPYQQPDLSYLNNNDKYGTVVLTNCLFYIKK
jgi:hypothetical protein